MTIADIWEYLSTTKFKIGFIAAIWGLLTGLERAIIIPTLWYYFSTTFSKVAANQYYGSTMAAFGVAILICDPLFGYLSFIKVRVKTLLVISNQLGIIGNIVYFIASHPWMLLLGRFLAGAGAGCEVPLYADIVRITTTNERTGYIVTLLLCRQFGLIFGPACTVVMSDIEFNIGKVNVNRYNGPGLLLAILWGIHTILVLLIYPQLSKEKKESLCQPMIIRKEKLPLITPPPTPMDCTEYHRPSYCSDVIDAATISNLTAKTQETIQEENNDNENNSTLFSSFFNTENYKDYINYHVLSTLTIIFGSYFSLMGLETVLPPMAEQNFKWSTTETSYVYLGCGLAVIIVYLVLRIIISHGWKDRYLLLIGLVFLFISYLWLSISIGLIDKKRPTLFIILIIIGISLHVIGQPFVVSCSESLYTKQVSVVDQDRAQSILRMVINVALLIGPFIGGSMEYMPSIVFIIMFILITIGSGLLLLKFNLFKY